MALFFSSNPPTPKSKREIIRDEIDEVLLSDEEDLANEIGKFNSFRKTPYNKREREIIQKFGELKNSNNLDESQIESRPLEASSHLNTTAPAPVLDCRHIFECSESGGALSGELNPQLKTLAVGCRNGDLNIIQTSSGNLLDKIHISPTASKAAMGNDSQRERAPITAIRWRKGESESTSNVLIAADASGRHSIIHSTTKTLMRQQLESSNQILAVEYMQNLPYYVTAGTDSVIRIYDENTGQLVRYMKYIGKGTTGHVSRITCLHEMQNERLLLSGSWDSSIHCWDLRMGTDSGNKDETYMSKPARSLHGTYLCGNDSIDDFDSIIATASTRSKRCLQLWDIGSGQLVTTYDHSASGSNLYCARFLDNQRLMCGGSGDGVGVGDGSVKVLDIASGRKLADYKCVRNAAVFGLSFVKGIEDKETAIGIVSAESAEFVFVY